MSMKFLHKKGWHPATLENQKRKWMAEQQTKARLQREREAAMEVKRSREQHEQRLVRVVGVQHVRTRLGCGVHMHTHGPDASQGSGEEAGRHSSIVYVRL